MASCKNILICLMVSIAVCASAMSCKPKGPLAKEQIIKIADRAARKNGRDPKDCDAVFDERPNRISAAKGSWLESHDFEVVVYTFREPRLAGAMIVLVDRNTGEVLGVIVQP